MNDPHVVALIYRIEHGQSVNYSKAKPLNHEEADFRIRSENGQVHFEFKAHAHYATLEAARKVIEKYISKWEFSAPLWGGLGCFKLRFERGKITDRDPSHPPSLQRSASVSFSTGAPTMHCKATRVGFIGYPPPPPSEIEIDSEKVKCMRARYMAHLQREEPLTTVAYFCLTVLGLEGKMKRKDAAKKYQIAEEVLRKIGNLSSTRGGRQARKAAGLDKKLTTKECHFLERATRAIICRMAEKAHSPDKKLPEISLNILDCHSMPGSRSCDSSSTALGRKDRSCWATSRSRTVTPVNPAQG